MTHLYTQLYELGTITNSRLNYIIILCKMPLHLLNPVFPPTGILTLKSCELDLGPDQCHVFPWLGCYKI